MQAQSNICYDNSLIMSNIRKYVFFFFTFFLVLCEMRMPKCLFGKNVFKQALFFFIIISHIVVAMAYVFVKY